VAETEPARDLGSRYSDPDAQGHPPRRASAALREAIKGSHEKKERVEGHSANCRDQEEGAGKRSETREITPVRTRDEVSTRSGGGDEPGSHEEKHEAPEANEYEAAPEFPRPEGSERDHEERREANRRNDDPTGRDA